MKMKNMLMAAALAACLGGWSGAASAAATATSLIGPLRVALLDLTPDDGVAPSFELQLVNGGPEVLSKNIWMSSEGQYPNYGTSGYGTLTRSLTGVSAESTLTPTSQYSEVNAGGVPLTLGAGANVRSYWISGFTLGPNTEVRIMADLTLSAMHAEGETAVAEANLVINGVPNAGSEDYYIDTGSYSGSFWRTTYSGDTALQGTLSLSAGASAFAPASPVPEPGTWAMLLAGFAIVGAATRSGRQRR